MLDSEFALIIYDSKTDSLIAARDPIGIRPLYYGYLEDGSIVFASEAKNLVGLCREIMPFPPGHYYYMGEFVRYCDITKVDEYIKYGSGHGLQGHQAASDRRRRQTPGLGRAAWFPAFRRA
jgi:asparagine synthase (glutamine-hydrolysing)